MEHAHRSKSEIFTKDRTNQKNSRVFNLFLENNKEMMMLSLNSSKTDRFVKLSHTHSVRAVVPKRPERFSRGAGEISGFLRPKQWYNL